jgi:aminoacrylate hydrolase
MSGDTRALMDYLDIDGAAVVWQSTGGAIGQHLAASQPDRISRLVLSSTWTHADAYFTRLFELLRLAAQRGDGALYTRDGSLLLYSPEWLREDDREVSVAEAQSVTSASSPRIVISRIEALLRFDRRALAPRVRCPTLVIAALDDRVTPAYFSPALAQAIPEARPVLLDGAGHFLPIVEAERYAEIVLRFLSEPDG